MDELPFSPCEFADFLDFPWRRDSSKIASMNTVHEIENAIKNLNPTELADFRRWYVKFDADAWDDEIRRDAETGRLDFLIDEAHEDMRLGRVKDL